MKYALMLRYCTVGLFSYRSFIHRYFAKDHFSHDKAAPFHAVKACRGSRCIAPLILDFGASGREWSASRPGRFTPQAKATAPSK